jgi:hypothetical protein
MEDVTVTASHEEQKQRARDAYALLASSSIQMHLVALDLLEKVKSEDCKALEEVERELDEEEELLQSRS